MSQTSTSRQGEFQPILTIDDERLLLIQLQKMETRHGCRCKNCLMKEARIQAFKLACDLHIDCPESWNTEGKADYKWLKGFTERHKDKISQFPSICSLTVFTIDEEQLLLNQLQDMEIQRDCRCKNCLMEEGRIRAYGLACILHIDCPESWNTEGKADYVWLDDFTERHRDEISKFQSICSLTVLTIDQERWLLRQLQDIKIERECRCKNCLMEEGRIRAYGLACVLRIDCPESWNREGIADYGWLEGFTDRHRDEISKFPSTCSLTVFTIDEERLLLTQLQDMKIERDCKCINCIMEDMRILAYELARASHRNYPESWNIEGKADYRWMKGFTERHNNKVSNFPTVCKGDLSQTSQTSKQRQYQPIFTPQNEQLLLIQLQEMETQHGCKCQNCILEEASTLAYKLACNLKKDYPQSWNRDGKAGSSWLNNFTERHIDEILKFPTVCNLVSTNRLILTNRPILTNDDEQLLLTHLQEVKARGGCKCKNCFMKEVKKDLACKISRDLYENYPEWSKDENAIHKWLRRFEERHKIEISEFPTVCNRSVLTNRPVLTNDDEQLLLIYLQEMKARDDCKCKHCFAKDMPRLAYKVVCDLNRNYPEWKGEENATYKWLRRFEERHKIEISEFPTVCYRPVLTNLVFTNDDEQQLLTYLQEIKVQGAFKCKNCFMKEMKEDLACKIFRDLYQNYPEWTKDENAIHKWLRHFGERHKIEISEFATVCKRDLSQASTSDRSRSTSILTTDDEQLLLLQVQKMETRHGCKCKNCLLKEVPILAYKLACNLKRDYPQSWNREGKAGSWWLNNFIHRNIDKISKFSTVCKRDLSQASTSRQRQSIFTTQNEQLLLIQLQEMEVQHGCKCQICLLEKVPTLAYKLACNLKRNPKSWNAKGKATVSWLSKFKKRHYDEISKFPTVCNRSVLTNDDEQLLLTHLQDVKARDGCKCKNCFMKEVKEDLACKIFRDLNENFPEWSKDENAIYKWLRRFGKRHKIEIVKFPTVCKGDLSQALTSGRSKSESILRRKDEQLLLLQLQEMETPHGCKCKSCLLEELPILAYNLACNLKRVPQSWNAEGKAVSMWLSRFKKRHNDKISEFPTVCNRPVLTNRPVLINRSVLTNDDEQLLLTHLQEVKARGGCKCKHCFAKDVPSLAYKIVCDLNKNYPEWKAEENAMYKWLRRFEERHKIGISEFPTVCNRPVLTNRTVLTNNDEQLLLTHLQEIKAQGGCKCKNCFMKKVKGDLVCKISRDLYENYPEWSKDNNAMYKWLIRFGKRHKIEISEFPIVCKKDLSQASSRQSRSESILKRKDERLLLIQLEEMETRHGCKCQNCLLEEVSTLAYNLACNLKRVPQSWIAEKKAAPMWLTRFKKRYNDKISKFSTVCDRSVLTNNDEQLLLTHLQEVKARDGCKCKNCFMKEMKEDLACKIFRDLYKNYPELIEDENAIYKWLRYFGDRHNIEISKFPSICKKNLSQASTRNRREFCTIFKPEDEQLLLIHLQEMETQHGCKCKICLMEEMRILAYKMACDLKRGYPESWDKERKATRYWLKDFIQWHKDEISKFPTVRSVLTNDDEQLLLTYLQEVKARGSCKCKNCFMKEVKKNLACKISCDLYENYPEWREDENAIYKWLRRFEERHKIEITEFPTVCKVDLSQASNRQSQSESILKRKDERLLLVQLEEMETRHGCKCKSCLLEELPILAYNLACNLKRVPQSWIAEGKAVPRWLSKFKKRHSDKISKFRTVCNRSVLTNDDEQLLLTHLQDVKARGGCKCKNCFIKGVKVDIACKISRDLYKNYSEWIEDENAIYKWLRRFEERHNIEISKFPYICKKDLSQVLTSRQRDIRPILRPEDERLLLIQLQEMETRHGCKCKNCLLEELPIQAYRLACKLKRDPQSWNKEGKAEHKWLSKFRKRHYDEISKFPTVCNRPDLTLRSVLTNDDEQLLLLYLQEVKARDGCKCKHCFAKDVPHLASKIVCDLNKNYPEWNGEENAMYKWLRRFEERHNIEISKFPYICKKDLSQILTSRQRDFRPILRPEDERLLLIQLQEMETRHGCKCKNCLLEELPIQAYKLACKLKRDSQSWNKDGKAETKWLSRFIKRHYDEISKFPTVCNRPDLTLRSVLTNDEEQLLLLYLLKVKTRGGCKCKHCFAKDVPLLAHKIVRDLNINYPEWSEDENAIYKWLKCFGERYKIEIFKFPTVCNLPVLSNVDEQLLLTYLQEVKARGGCKCKHCFAKDVPLLAFKIVCDLNKNYLGWKREEDAMYKWLRHFEERHNVEASKFPSVCEAD